MTVWNGVVAPAGTPDGDAAQRRDQRRLALPEIKATLARFGSEPLMGSPQDFADFIAAEARKWAEIVKLAGVKVD